LALSTLIRNAHLTGLQIVELLRRIGRGEKKAFSKRADSNLVEFVMEG
jgi:hypothetical protein